MASKIDEAMAALEGMVEIPNLITIVGNEFLRKRGKLILAVLQYLQITMVEDGGWDDIGAPHHAGHGHRVRGHWDNDGSECERCKAWNTLQEIIDD